MKMKVFFAAVMISVMLLTGCVTRFLPYRQQQHPLYSYNSLALDKEFHFEKGQAITRYLEEFDNEYQIVKQLWSETAEGMFYLYTKVIYAQRTFVYPVLSGMGETVSIGRIIYENGNDSYLIFHAYFNNGGLPEPPAGILLQTDTETFIQRVEVTDVAHGFLVPHEIPDDFIETILQTDTLGINPQYPYGKGEILQPAMKWMNEEQLAEIQDFIRFTQDISFSTAGGP